jgi:hypothetical protein
MRCPTLSLPPSSSSLWCIRRHLRQRRRSRWHPVGPHRFAFAGGGGRRCLQPCCHRPLSSGFGQASSPPGATAAVDDDNKGNAFPVTYDVDENGNVRAGDPDAVYSGPSNAHWSGNTGGLRPACSSLCGMASQCGTRTRRGRGHTLELDTPC